MFEPNVKTSQMFEFGAFSSWQVLPTFGRFVFLAGVWPLYLRAELTNMAEHVFGVRRCYLSAAC